MRKKVIVAGVVLLIAGFIFGFLSGAVLPGNFTIPLIYGSNQIMWVFIMLIGVVTGIVGLFLKSKKNKKE